METIEWPKISIVITSYFESAKPYLDICIESIKNLSYPKDKLDVILVTKKSYLPAYDGVRTVYPNEDRFYNVKGINFGVSCADSDSKFYLICNDDIILTKDCLQPLVMAAQDQDCALQPILSCHNNYKYNLMIGYINNQEFHQISKRFNRIDDWLPIKHHLMNSHSVYNPGLIREKTMCLVSFLVPRKTWEKIGGFDESFNMGWDDTDWSIRATRAGVIMGTCLDSLIYHFGGTSTSESMTSEARQKSLEIFKNKWGFVPDGI